MGFLQKKFLIWALLYLQKFEFFPLMVFSVQMLVEF